MFLSHSANSAHDTTMTNTNYLKLLARSGEYFYASIDGTNKGAILETYFQVCEMCVQIRDGLA